MACPPFPCPPPASLLACVCRPRGSEQRSTAAPDSDPLLAAMQRGTRRGGRPSTRRAARRPRGRKAEREQSRGPQRCRPPVLPNSAVQRGDKIVGQGNERAQCTQILRFVGLTAFLLFDSAYLVTYMLELLRFIPQYPNFLLPLNQCSLCTSQPPPCKAASTTTNPTFWFVCGLTR